jgi:MoaA/NifB/PqqE/SkfB family radical SAM enzyme
MPEDIALLRGLLQDGVWWESDPLVRGSMPFICGAALRKLFYITAYGDVQPCCYLPLRCGNVREEPLEDIIRRTWRSGLRDGLSQSADCPLNHAEFRSRHPEIFDAPAAAAPRAGSAD